MKGDWAKPIELPAINVDDWPMDPTACSAQRRIRAQDPISQWADDNPDKLNGVDLRPHVQSVPRRHPEFLQEHGLRHRAA